METVRYGIVGCAGIGNTHAEAVEEAESATLVACVDLDPDAAREFADEHAVEAWYDDVAEMIEESDVDAVSVCTPSGTHADVTVEVAEAGAHVLCEKPLDVYADRMDRMIQACDDAGVKLAGVFQKRFHSASQRAKRALEDGDLGELVIGEETVKWFRSQKYYDSGAWRGTRDIDGGVLLNQAIHGIDRLQWLMGDVESVQAATDTIGREIECETAAAISLRFQNGAVGTISATTAAKAGTDRTDINGTEGTLSLSGTDDLSLTVGTSEEDYMNAETESRDIDVDHFEWGEGHTIVVEDFVDALREDREPAVPGREARKAVDIILAAYASDARGETVSIADIREGQVPEANADDA